MYQEAKAQKLPRLKGFEYLLCTWYTKDLRKDADNVSFATKFLLDGLVMAKVLPGDGRRYTGAIAHEFAVDRHNPRVEVLIE